jgi:hypothetical protein
VPSGLNDVVKYESVLQSPTRTKFNSITVKKWLYISITGPLLLPALERVVDLSLQESISNNGTPRLLERVFEGQIELDAVSNN